MTYFQDSHTTLTCGSGVNWYAVKDGDSRAVALFKRHYSCENPKADHVRYGFSGNGESMVLLTRDCSAVWCWRLVSGEGVVCSVFRNEGIMLSSELIREADELAWQRWPNERHFTYVNGDKVRHKRDPGRCFVKAGWHKCGISKGGLVILEKVMV